MYKNYGIMDFMRKKYSEEEIREVEDLLTKDNWEDISQYQNLSEDFIREFQNKINWYELSMNNSKLSDKFCEEFDEKIKYIYNDGSCKIDWMINHVYHRTLGPAVMFIHNDQGDYDFYDRQYWYRGQYLKDIHSMEEYQRWLNLRLFA